MSVAAGLRGAMLLARGRAEGIQLAGTGHAAVIGSFWAMPLCLPAILAMKLIGWHGVWPAHAPLLLGRHLLLFAIGWLLFVWVSHYLAHTIDKDAQWPRFIVVWSFCNVIENSLAALGAIPGAFGAPAMLDEAFQLVAIGWAVWLEWYGIRLSLEVGPLTALVLLAVDTIIGVGLTLIGAVMP